VFACELLNLFNSKDHLSKTLSLAVSNSETKNTQQPNPLVLSFIANISLHKVGPEAHYGALGLGFFFFGGGDPSLLTYLFTYSMEQSPS